MAPFVFGKTPKQVLLQTVKTQMKCSIMHNAALHCNGQKRSSDKRIQFFLNYDVTTLNMYNGLSQIYCIKPEGRIYQYANC